MGRYENSHLIFSCNKYLTNRRRFLFTKELIWTNLWFVDYLICFLNYHNTNNLYLYTMKFIIYYEIVLYDWFVALWHTTCFLRNSLHNRVIKSINNLSLIIDCYHTIFLGDFMKNFFFLFRSYIPRRFYTCHIGMPLWIKWWNMSLLGYVNF